MLVDNFESFRLPPVPVRHKFSVDDHLASIIHDPEDKINIYKKG